MTGISLREAQMRLAGMRAELLRMRAGGVVSAFVQPARSTLGRGRAAMRFGLSHALRARAAVVCAFIDGTPDLPPVAMRALLAERERSGQMLDDSEARAVVRHRADCARVCGDVDEAKPLIHAQASPARQGAGCDCEPPNVDAGRMRLVEICLRRSAGQGELLAVRSEILALAAPFPAELELSPALACLSGAAR